MTFDDKCIILDRIISGKYRALILDDEYDIYSPTRKLIADSQRHYQYIKEKAKFENWITDNQKDFILLKSGIDRKKNLAEIEIMEHRITQIKISIYDSMMLGKKVDSLKKQLKSIKNYIGELFTSANYLSECTIDGFAKTSAEEFLLLNTVFDIKNNCFLDENCLYTTYAILSNHITENYLSEPILRELSRTEPWRSYWNLGKKNIFSDILLKLTEEQKYLLTYSQMYDNIYQSPKCPPDFIIEDDDALDGWWAKETKEREEESKNSSRSKKGAGHKHAQEIFVPVNSPEEAAKVEELNSPISKMIKDSRIKYVAARNEEVREAELPDVKQKISMQSVQQFKDRMKSNV